MHFWLPNNRFDAFLFPVIALFSSANSEDMTDRMERISKMLEDAPADPFLRFARAKEWEKKEDWISALAEYDWLVKHAPEYTGTYYHYGHLLIRQNRTDQAKEIFEQGMRISQEQNDRHTYGELRSLYEEYILD